MGIITTALRPNRGRTHPSPIETDTYVSRLASQTWQTNRRPWPPRTTNLSGIERREETLNREAANQSRQAGAGETNARQCREIRSRCGGGGGGGREGNEFVPELFFLLLESEEKRRGGGEDGNRSRERGRAFMARSPPLAPAPPLAVVRCGAERMALVLASVFFFRALVGPVASSTRKPWHGFARTTCTIRRVRPLDSSTVARTLAGEYLRGASGQDAAVVKQWSRRARRSYTACSRPRLRPFSFSLRKRPHAALLITTNQYKVSSSSRYYILLLFLSFNSNLY